MKLLHFDYSNLRHIFLQAVVIVCFGIATGLMFNYPLLMQSLESDASTVEPASTLSGTVEKEKVRP